MRSILLVAALVSGCGGRSSSSANKVNPCERIDTLCRAEFDAADLKECTAQLPDVIGDGWDAFVGCSSNAASCSEVLQCTAGSLDERGRRLLSQLARGHDSSGSRRHGDETLPRECERANEVCADDEPFARRECARMVGNLKADAQNTAKLVACYGESKNCFTFQRCTDQLWRDLN